MDFNRLGHESIIVLDQTPEVDELDLLRRAVLADLAETRIRQRNGIASRRSA